MGVSNYLISPVEVYLQAILDANGMYRSVKMSAMEGPDCFQHKICNVSNICKLHEPTRCYMYTCHGSTDRDQTVHLRRPSIQNGLRQLYTVRRLDNSSGTKEAQSPHTSCQVVVSTLSYVICRVVHARGTDASFQYSRRISFIGCSRVEPPLSV